MFPNDKAVVLGIALAFGLAGCSSTKSTPLTQAEKDEQQKARLVQYQDTLSAPLVELVDKVKEAPYEPSAFFGLHAEAGTFIEGAIPEDDVLVLYNYRSGKPQASLVTLSFVDGKVFSTGSTAMLPEAHGQLNALLDAVAQNSDLTLSVSAYDGFNPYDRDRTKNATAITKKQIDAIEAHIRLYSPRVLTRTTFSAMGNSHILELGVQDFYYKEGRTYVGKDTSPVYAAKTPPPDPKKWQKEYSSNFYEMYHGYSVRVDFEISEMSK